MTPVFFPRSPCSIEPNTAILAQSSMVETEIEPKWLTQCDAPYREIPTFLRLRRCRGMRHTGTMVIALTGCVAHRSKQGKRTAPFSRAESFLRTSRGHPLTPVQNN